MRKVLLLCSLALMLSCGFAYGVFAQEEPEYTPAPYNQPPQAWIAYYENEITKCQEFVDQLSLVANKAQILFENEELNSPLRRIYTREKYEAETDGSITTRHQALRRGAEVRFKNNTSNIVTMDVPRARTIGNEAVFTVTNANGTIPINLKGLGRGAFSISYEVRPPQKR